MQKLTNRLITSLLLFLILGILVAMRPTPALAQEGPPPEQQSAQIFGPNNMPVPPFAPGEVLVGVRADSAVAAGANDAWGGLEVQAVEPLDVRGAELSVVSSDASGAGNITGTNPGPLVGYKLTVPAGTEWDAIAALKARSDVVFAEPDWLAQIAQSVPNHATAETPFAVTDTLYPDQWYMQRIGMSRAWSVAEEESGGNLSTAHVFLLDTGSDLTHPDLVSKLSGGHNYLDSLASPQDDNGHGTHVSGLIAAALNGSGTVGPGLKVKITPFKVLNANGTGLVSVIGQAIRDAADQGADIINMSLEISVDTFELRSAAAYAVSKGVLIIAASGNQGRTTVSYPAAYPSVLAVGATSYYDAVAYYSNRGADLDMVAPGGLSGNSILSTWTSDVGTVCPSGLRQVDDALYCESNGTSMSSGIVSGVAGLIMSLRPDLDADAVQQILLETADPIAGTTNEIGHGRLDAAKAVQMAVKPGVVFDNDVAHFSVLQDAKPFTVTVPLTNPSLAPIDVELTPTVTTTWYALVGPHVGEVSYGSPFSVQLVFTPTAAGVGNFTSAVHVSVTVGSLTTIGFINVELDVSAIGVGLHHYLAWLSTDSDTFDWAEPNFTPRTTRTIDSDGSLVVNLPFTMTVNDEEFTDLRVYADGFVIASAVSTPINLPNRCFANQTFPPFTVDGWWSDLSVGIDSALSTFQPDADHFVIEYDKFASSGSVDPDNVVTFQIVLDRNGQVELNYEQVPKETPANLTISASADDGRFYNQITCQKAGTIHIGDAPDARILPLAQRGALLAMGTPDHRAKAASEGSVPIAIVTVSDTRTPETDSSGQLIRKLIEEAGHHVTGYRIVRDEPDEVRAALEEFTDGRARLVIFNGGTGISKRDRTYDVISKALEKTLPGFGEFFRMFSLAEVGTAAMMSRATAGVYRDTVIFSTPGSPNAVQVAVEKLILPEIQHLAWELGR